MIGDMMADFVDAGGLVVRASFMGPAGAGRIASPGYGPLKGNSGSIFDNPACLGSFDSSNKIMAGVTSICADTFRGDWAGVDPGATLVASWDDDLPFVAINAMENVIDISVYPSTSWEPPHVTGDYKQLFRNALAYRYVADAPEPASLALFGAGLLGVWSRRRKN